MERPELPSKVKTFCREKAIDGFTTEEITLLVQKNSEFAEYGEDKLSEYLERDSTQQKIELEKNIQEKQAEISREDLIRELGEQKDYIIRQREKLEGSNDEISDQQTKNLLKAIRQLGELIDVLESKDSQGAGNMVNVNKLEQNFNVAQTVEYMPRQDVEDVVEALENHPDIEDFAVSWKEDEEQKIKA